VEVSEHLDAFGAEGLALASAARDAGPEALVPTCPGWRVRDLIRHTGMVHRWATGMVVDESRTCREAADEPALDATGKRSGSGARHGHPAGLAAPRPAHRAAPLRLTRR